MLNSITKNLHQNLSTFISMLFKSNSYIQNFGKLFLKFFNKENNKPNVKFQKLIKKYYFKWSNVRFVYTLAAAYLLLNVFEVKAQFVMEGPELHVNTTTVYTQWSSSIAMNKNGAFVIVWEDIGQKGVFAQRFDAYGAPIGSEIQINTNIELAQLFPKVAMDSVGNFVVTWCSFLADGQEEGIFARRFNASGISLGAEFLVNTYTNYNQNNPAIAMNNAGDFVISWTSSNQDGSNGGIYAQRFNSIGVSQGIEFRVNSYTYNDQASSRIAMDNNGNFVVTWQSFGQDGVFGGVYAQRYNADGSAQGAEFRVNTSTSEAEFNPAIAMAYNGDFVISWTSSNQDGSGDGIYAQRFNALGQAQGLEFRVNTIIEGNQIGSKVAMSHSGDFVISWQSNGEDGSGYGIYAQGYSVSGAPRGIAFRANTYTANDQEYPAIAMDSLGNFAITWTSFRQIGVSEANDVYAQLFTNDLITSSFDNSSIALFNLNPNPAKHQVRITLESAATIRILNLSGCLLLEQSDGSNIVDVEGLSPGIYIVEVIQDNFFGREKLFVE